MAAPRAPPPPVCTPSTGLWKQSGVPAGEGLRPVWDALGGEAPLTVSPGQKGETGPAFPLCGAWPGGGALGQEPPGLCISSESGQSGPSLPQFPAQSPRKARHGHWCQRDIGSRGRLCLLTPRSSFTSTNSRCGWCWGPETRRGAGGPSAAVQSGRACGGHRRERARSGAAERGSRCRQRRAGSGPGTGCC